MRDEQSFLLFYSRDGVRPSDGDQRLERRMLGTGASGIATNLHRWDGWGGLVRTQQAAGIHQGTRRPGVSARVSELGQCAPKYCQINDLEAHLRRAEVAPTGKVTSCFILIVYNDTKSLEKALKYSPKSFLINNLSIGFFVDFSAQKPIISPASAGFGVEVRETDCDERNNGFVAGPSGAES